jgi:hypothetical protein
MSALFRGRLLSHSGSVFLSGGIGTKVRTYSYNDTFEIVMVSTFLIWAAIKTHCWMSHLVAMSMGSRHPWWWRYGDHVEADMDKRVHTLPVPHTVEGGAAACLERGSRRGSCSYMERTSIRTSTKTGQKWWRGVIHTFTYLS